MQENEENTMTSGESYFETSTQQIAVEEPILHEDENHVEEHHNELDFSGLNKEQLFHKLEEIVKSDEVQSASGKVRLLREAYFELVKTETDAKRNLYIEEGGLAEDFEMRKDALDDKFEALASQFNKKRSELKAQKEKQILENTATKKLIIQELKDMMMGEENISKAYQKFQALQSKWRSVGAVTPAEANNLWQNYQFCVSQFFDVMKISKDLRELDQKKNLELKTELCEKAEKLAEENSLRKAVDELKLLQNQWREIGNVGKEANEQIWERFKIAADKVYAKLKENLVKVRAKQDENLQAKTALCAKLDEELTVNHTNFNDWKKATERVTEIWNQWQKIGFTPKEDNNATWNRFKQTRQKFYNQKDVFFNALRDEQNKNLALKTALCEKAESMVDNKDWAATTEAYKKIQAEWKKVGAVPRKVSDKIWFRFKKACDLYFENKNKNFAERDAVLIDNHTKKMEVIAKFQSLEIQDDNKANLEAVKNLQQEFSAIGEVPYKQFESLQTTYRAAVNEYLGKIKEKKGSEDRTFYQMKYEQLQQTPQGKDEISKERFHLQDKIKRIQADINQLENNLGFFGKSKNADAMKAEFQQKIDRSKEEVTKLKAQLKMIPHV
ncbi:MAG: DUF349 domain-containing protein [Bacteroidetes bacterium]|nr:DUF349 domain-containing protein [Bacteroidota bacterium]